MSLEPMEFEKATTEHLGTWNRVCRMVIYVSAALIFSLSLLAFFLL